MPSFTAGSNVAIKVPGPQYESTVAFYRDVLGLPLERRDDHSHAFTFGDGRRLWIDRMPALPRGDVWLEIAVDDLDAAREHFERHGVVLRPEVEPLAPSLRAFWASDPSGAIVLVSERSSD
jgi:predicted enzyme related to lactoylglutathione lyase